MHESLRCCGEQEMPVCRSIAGNRREEMIIDGKLRCHEVVIIQVVAVEESHHAMPVLVRHVDPQPGCNLADVETYRNEPIHWRTGRSCRGVLPVEIDMRWLPIRCE